MAGSRFQIGELVDQLKIRVEVLEHTIGDVLKSLNIIIERLGPMAEAFREVQEWQKQQAKPAIVSSRTASTSTTSEPPPKTKPQDDSSA